MATPRECDQSVRVPCEQFVREPWHSLGSFEMGRTREPAQAAVPGSVLRQQDQVRAELPRANAAEVFLACVPMARWPLPFGGRRCLKAVSGSDRWAQVGLPSFPCPLARH